LSSRAAGTYKFLHDRVKEAAYLLIPKELRAEVHLRIGRLLIAKMTQEEIADSIFNVVNHLNLGAALIADRGEKVRAASLNLRVGRKAKASTAYASACIYLSAGMSLVCSDGLEKAIRYELAFALCLERASVNS
jgi:predicted ATPase